MDPWIQFCIDVIRHRVCLLLSRIDEPTEENNLDLRELSELRDEIDELNYLLTMQ